MRKARLPEGDVALQLRNQLNDAPCEWTRLRTALLSELDTEAEETESASPPVQPLVNAPAMWRH
jgi:hypothetical protein